MRQITQSEVIVTVWCYIVVAYYMFLLIFLGLLRFSGYISLCYSPVLNIYGSVSKTSHNFLAPPFQYDWRMILLGLKCYISPVSNCGIIILSVLS